MPPPPITPSPRRFVIKKKSPLRRTPLAREQTPRPSASQFNATPRFRPGGTQSVPTPTLPPARYATPARLLPKQEDIVDDLSDDNTDVYDTIETADQDEGPSYLSDDANRRYRAKKRASKRRRLSSSPALHNDGHVSETNESLADFPDSSPIPIIPSPQARHPASSAAPRFLPSTRASQPAPQQSQAAFLKPPRFRPPDPSEQGQPSADPLPEQFSPHRRGQKYVPGGLAAEVRDWLVNIESAIPSKPAPRMDSPWLVSLMVDEISGGGRAGMTLVRGRQVRSDDPDGMIDSLGIISVILAGEGAGTGLQKGATVEVGKTVGIKAPVWEVVIEGVKWGVGVDWKVLP